MLPPNIVVACKDPGRDGPSTETAACLKTGSSEPVDPAASVRILESFQLDIGHALMITKVRISKVLASSPSPYLLRGGSAANPTLLGSLIGAKTQISGSSAKPEC